MFELFLIRHGPTEWSRSHRLLSSTDLALLAEGRSQAKRLPALLQKLLGGRSFASVYSSPMRRAFETASLAVPNAEVRTSDWLREFEYGDYEGLSLKDIRGSEPSWEIWRDRCPRGESAADVGARMDQFLKLCEGAPGPVAVFSHRYSLQILAARAIGFNASDGRIFELGAPASVSLLRSVNDQLAVTHWNMVSEQDLEDLR